MGRFLGLAFTLLFSLDSFAALPGPAPIVTVAAPGQNSQGVSIPLSCLSSSASGTGCPGKIFSLYAGQSMTGSDFYPLFRDGVAYATPSNAKAYCMNQALSSATSSVSMQFVSSQTAFSAGAGSIVSGTYQCGSSSSTNCNIASNTAGAAIPVAGTYTFGDGSHVTYAGLQANNTDRINVNLICYEAP